MMLADQINKVNNALGFLTGKVDENAQSLIDLSREKLTEATEVAAELESLAAKVQPPKGGRARGQD